MRISDWSSDVCSSDLIEAGGAIGLVFDPWVAQLADVVEERCAGERVAGLALVESGLGAAAQVEIAQPVEHEDRALDPPNLAQGQRQSVLARICGQAAQHSRSGGGAAADRSGETQQ